MPKKTRDQRRQAKTDRIASRGIKRSANREVRKEERTERLAARKNISTDQAKQLQGNRRERFREFAQGGLENIKTGRLRFGDEGQTASPEASKDTSSTANAATGGSDALAASAAQANANLGKLQSDRLGMAQDAMIGRGGTAYNPEGKTASVEVGQHELGPDAGFSRKARGAAGYN